jgi:archaellum component FlaC
VGITTWYRFVLDTITGGNFLMCPTLDAFNAMGNLVGSPPIITNETTLTLEHVMQRLEAIENKMPTIEHLENLDKKVHNHITQFGSNVGIALKTLKEKEPIINERIDQSSARIDKLEEIFNKLGSAFSSTKNIDRTARNKNCKFIYVPKVKGATSSKGSEDLKMISVYPNFINIIKEPIHKNKILDFVPRSVMMRNSYVKSIRKKGCVIEELETKDDNT